MRALLSFLVFTLLRVLKCLWIQAHLLVDSRVEEVLWIQNIALLEDQGLWIQTSVLHLSLQLIID